MSIQSESSKKIIHKRMIDTSKNGSTTYTLCCPHQKFSGREYDYTNIEFKMWELDNKCHWRFVTCPYCLRLGGFRNPKSK